MIGIIISGHGNFASGLSTSLKLIVGETDNFEYVDFEEEDSIETLKEKYYNSLKNLDSCDKILALTDLVGGSPFKTLVEVKTEIKKQMEVIGGTNLPMALEITMSKDSIEDLESLVETCAEVGKKGIVKFQFIAHEEIECEEGI